MNRLLGFSPVHRCRWALLLVYLPCALASLHPAGSRRVLDLNGTWEVAQGSLASVPRAFPQRVPVPGLIDMAQPAFVEVGQPSSQRQAFWYRCTFQLEGPAPDIVQLKIHKARYGTKVMLNGRVVGEHLPCFTPAYLDLRGAVRDHGQENELLIRVGADRGVLPKGMPTGWDFEKYRYLPGIYDSVEVILASAPYLVNVQTVPDLDRQAVRVVAEIETRELGVPTALQGEVRELRSGKRVGTAATAPVRLRPRERQTVELTIPLSRCRFWSPEDPFLYELMLSTGADAVKVRFGMRSFRFEPGGKYALLNGRRYFLRGSNVTVYRFFEDAERGDKPWRRDWVRQLHRQFKTMHWNSLRYCIGFPPESWYAIADEEGFLIQDEFPIWTLGEDPEKLQAEKIIPEYRDWMRERWNHPCVVIWDAQNESSIAATGQALQAVRHLDLSQRPWENGWAEPQSPTDCVEAHPYLMIRTWQNQTPFRMSDMPKVSGVPTLQAAQQKLSVPILINEYGWLWLTRDGQPTCLTDKVYENLLGKDSTVEQRRLVYAKCLAAKTEFWRAHRECAGVLHFCGLGYSRPGDKPRPEGGATSDHWIDLGKLKFEPTFAAYVRDAFNPVGVMLDFWEETLPPNAQLTLPVFVVNDLEPAWQGTVQLKVTRDGKTLEKQARAVQVASFGRATLTFYAKLPAEPGAYTLAAELRGPSMKPVRSQRDVQVK